MATGTIKIDNRLPLSGYIASGSSVTIPYNVGVMLVYRAERSIASVYAFYAGTLYGIGTNISGLTISSSGGNTTITNNNQYTLGFTIFCNEWKPL